MLDTAVFIVTKEIAQRSGLINVRYQTKDGRFILDSTDLSRVRIKSDEYTTGLQGVERISAERARVLIEENGHKMGDHSYIPTQVSNNEKAEATTENAENKEEEAVVDNEPTDDATETPEEEQPNEGNDDEENVADDEDEKNNNDENEEEE